MAKAAYPTFLSGLLVMCSSHSPALSGLIFSSWRPRFVQLTRNKSIPKSATADTSQLRPLIIGLRRYSHTNTAETQPRHEASGLHTDESATVCTDKRSNHPSALPIRATRPSAFNTHRSASALHPLCGLAQDFVLLCRGLSLYCMQQRPQRSASAKEGLPKRNSF